MFDETKVREQFTIAIGEAMMIHATIEGMVDVIIRKTTASPETTQKLIRLPATRKIDELKRIILESLPLLTAQAELNGENFRSINNEHEANKFIERLKASFNQRNAVAHSAFGITRMGDAEPYGALSVWGRSAQMKVLKHKDIVAIKKAAIELHSLLTIVLAGILFH